MIKLLNLADEKQIKPWIEVLPMSKCGEGVKRVEQNDIRYRFVYKQDIE